MSDGEPASPAEKKRARRAARAAAADLPPTHAVLSRKPLASAMSVSGLGREGSRVYLHIGTMKSGTTFIQRRLQANAQALTDRGVLVPAAWGASVVAATREVLGMSTPRGPESVAGRWDALCRQLAAWEGRASIVSMEFFSTAEQEAVDRVIDGLRPSDIQVLITARDLARVIPSAWQESTQNAAVWTYEEYVDSIVAEDGERPGSRFWRQQNVADMIKSWGSAVGVENVHLITVPPSGSPPDLLWNRFCGAIGENGADFPEDIEESRANLALGHASAEFMRRFNVELKATNVNKQQYQQYVKRMVAKESLNQRKTEDKVVLPKKYASWVYERGQRMVADIEATGVDVIGDLAELIPDTSRLTTDVHEVSEDEVVDAAVETIAVLVLELTRGYRRAKARE